MENTTTTLPSDPSLNDERLTRDDTLELGLRRSRVLLIEDDSALRHLLRQLLLDQGYEVVEAADGADGFQRLRFHRLVDLAFLNIDLIVTDLMLPHMTGLEFVELIRDQGITIDVVLISAFADDQVWEMARHLGVHSVLPKPFPLDEFVDTVERLMPPWQ